METAASDSWIDSSMGGAKKKLPKNVFQERERMGKQSNE
jgi:hypothetical protein